MAERADSVVETRRRILDAAVALLRERLRSDIRLEAVADRAGVGVQTVLRHFGSRTALLDAAIAGVRSHHAAQRPSLPGDLARGVTLLFDQYEEIGDLVLRNLAEEDFDAGLKRMLDVGRAFHREWVEAQFGPTLSPALSRRSREDVMAALGVVCDVYSWKLLRRDLRLTRGRAERIMRRLIDGVVITADIER